MNKIVLNITRLGCWLRCLRVSGLGWQGLCWTGGTWGHPQRSRDVCGSRACPPAGLWGGPGSPRWPTPLEILLGSLQIDPFTECANIFEASGQLQHHGQPCPAQGMGVLAPCTRCPVGGSLGAAPEIPFCAAAWAVWAGTSPSVGEFISCPRKKS